MEKIKRSQEYGTREAAEMIGMNINTFKVKIKLGQIVGRRVSGVLLFKGSDLIALRDKPRRVGRPVGAADKNPRPRKLGPPSPKNAPGRPRKDGANVAGALGGTLEETYSAYLPTPNAVEPPQA